MWSSKSIIKQTIFAVALSSCCSVNSEIFIKAKPTEQFHIGTPILSESQNRLYLERSIKYVDQSSTRTQPLPYIRYYTELQSPDGQTQRLSTHNATMYDGDEIVPVGYIDLPTNAASGRYTVTFGLDKFSFEQNRFLPEKQVTLDFVKEYDHLASSDNVGPQIVNATRCPNGLNSVSYNIASRLTQTYCEILENGTTYRLAGLATINKSNNSCSVDILSKQTASMPRLCQSELAGLNLLSQLSNIVELSGITAAELKTFTTFGLSRSTAITESQLNTLNEQEYLEVINQFGALLDSNEVKLDVLKSMTLADIADKYHEFYANSWFKLLSLNATGATPSTLSVEQRRELILNNLPLWVTAHNETWTSKSIQTYRHHDIKQIKTPDHTVAQISLWPFGDKRHFTVNGQYNVSTPLKHMMGNAQVQPLGDTPKTLGMMDPQVTPTYVFYQELKQDSDKRICQGRPGNEIWLRYFVTFGYNNVPDEDFGNHFFDLEHISVALCQNENQQYQPELYFYSEHAGGDTFGAADPRMKYFQLSTPNTLKQISLDEAKQQSEFHPVVFLANGTHEAYVSTGHHGAGPRVDTTSWGNLVVPFANKHIVEPNDVNQIKTASVYSWDISDPQYNFAQTQQIESSAVNQLTGSLLKSLPRQLLPIPAHAFGYQNHYINIFFGQQNPSSKSMSLIHSIGRDAYCSFNGCMNVSDDLAVEGPVTKVLTNWTEFKK